MARIISRFAEVSFFCKRGHRTRQWVWNTVETVACQTARCRLKACRASLLAGRNAQGFKPPIVAFNQKTGEYRHLAGPRARIPSGFQRVELRTSPEIKRALSAMDARDREAHERKQEREERGREGYRDSYRDYKSQTEQGARLEQQARDWAARHYTPRYSSSNYIEAFEMNPSSLKED